MARRMKLSTIVELRNKYPETGEVNDKPGIDPQRKTTESEDRHVLANRLHDTKKPYMINRSRCPCKADEAGSYLSSS